MPKEIKFRHENDEKKTNLGEKVKIKKRKTTKRNRQPTQPQFSSLTARVSDEEDDEFYVIEKLLSKRIAQDGSEQFLVRWKGYSSDWDSWEPRSGIESNSHYLILQFEKNNNNKNKDTGDDILHCLCRKPYRVEDGAMIQCNNCFRWFHFDCIDLTIRVANILLCYYCDDCREIDYNRFKILFKPKKERKSTSFYDDWESKDWYQNIKSICYGQMFNCNLLKTWEYKKSPALDEPYLFFCIY